MRRLFCATGNTGKLREFRLAAREAPGEIELIPGFRDLPAADEDGMTFAENAVMKALQAKVAGRADGKALSAEVQKQLK